MYVEDIRIADFHLAMQNYHFVNISFQFLNKELCLSIVIKQVCNPIYFLLITCVQKQVGIDSNYLSI